MDLENSKGVEMEAARSHKYSGNGGPLSDSEVESKEQSIIP